MFVYTMHSWLLPKTSQTDFNQFVKLHNQITMLLKKLTHNSLNIKAINQLFGLLLLFSGSPIRIHSRKLVVLAFS